MFTIKAISYINDSPSQQDEDGGCLALERIQVERVSWAETYEVRRGHDYISVQGKSADDAITCYHEVYAESSRMGSSDACDSVYITNSEGKTIDRIHRKINTAPMPLRDAGKGVLASG